MQESSQSVVSSRRNVTNDTLFIYWHSQSGFTVLVHLASSLRSEDLLKWLTLMSLMWGTSDEEGGGWHWLNFRLFLSRRRLGTRLVSSHHLPVYTHKCFYYCIFILVLPYLKLCLPKIKVKVVSRFAHIRLGCNVWVYDWRNSWFQVTWEVSVLLR